MKLVVSPQVEVVTDLESDSDTKALAASQGKTLSNMITSTNSQMGSHIGMINAVASDVSDLDNRLFNVETPLKDSSGIFPSSGTNTPSGLVQLDSDGKLPGLDGSNLVNVGLGQTYLLSGTNAEAFTYDHDSDTYLLHGRNSMTVSFGPLADIQAAAQGIGITVAADDRSSDSNGSGQIFIFDRPMLFYYLVELDWSSEDTPDESYLYIDVSYDGGVNWEARHSSPTSRKYAGAVDFGTSDQSGPYWIEINLGDDQVSREGTVIVQEGWAIRARIGYIDSDATFVRRRLVLREV